MSRTYEPMDREAARQDPEVLAQATRRVTEFFNSEGLYPGFDPADEPTPETLNDIDAVTVAVRAAFRDRDWIEGYQRGLVDAERAIAGLELVGPGITQDPRDGGFSPSGTRALAYNEGREAGAS